ncbi:lytic murein transglycosylase B [bacterium]|nr:lytic murein transglycosylase B [bacterium]
MQQWRNVLRGLLIVASVAISTVLIAEEQPEPNYAGNEKAQAFIEKMVTEHGLDRAYVTGLIADSKRKQSILDAISRPAEKTKTWKDYRKIFVTETRTKQGKQFMQEYKTTLARAEKDFGVPKEIITAIIGVETRYGRHAGNYRVLDALATLGFDYPPRSKFFSGQLEQYLLLVNEQKFDPKSVKGSYAGAMGYGQFIPSSYRHYAIDYDGDGVADIITNPIDAIGSVANYFKAHGWKPGADVVLKAEVTDTYKADLANASLKSKHTIGELKTLGYQPLGKVSDDAKASPFRYMGAQGEEFWLGLDNFYVITRYNHSRLYAMAVYQLSLELK